MVQRSSSLSSSTPVAEPRCRNSSTALQNAGLSASRRRRSPSRAWTARSSTSDANALPEELEAPVAGPLSLLIDHLEHRVERIADLAELLAGAQQQLVDLDEALVGAAE